MYINRECYYLEGLYTGCFTLKNAHILVSYSVRHVEYELSRGHREKD